MRPTLAGRALLALPLVLAACRAPAPPPAPAPPSAAVEAEPPAEPAVPVELYSDDEQRIGYIPATLEWLPDGAWQVLALREHAEPQSFGDVRYTGRQTRIRLRCGEAPTISTWSDSLYLDDAVVHASTYGSTVWALVDADGTERWPRAICARADSALADPAGDPAGRLAAAPGLADAKRAYLRAWLGPDPARVGDSFADDVTVQLGDESITGRARTMERWVGADHGRVRGVRMVTGALEAEGATATERGRFWVLFRGRDGVESEETGTFVHGWTRGADGRWRLRAVVLTPDPRAE